MYESCLAAPLGAQAAAVKSSEAKNWKGCSIGGTTAVGCLLDIVLLGGVGHGFFQALFYHHKPVTRHDARNVPFCISLRCLTCDDDRFPSGSSVYRTSNGGMEGGRWGEEESQEGPNVQG